MPEKEGAEEKSTKSVVNKKQKQMMGEEGYDIARDMGRVRPSKDKKDATTMPVSDEVKKTQKVNKGPSALELVKKKYKGQIMNVGKKKVKEELDLTQVAEAFGGYIIEKSEIRKIGDKTYFYPTKGEKTAAKEVLKKFKKKGDETKPDIDKPMDKPSKGIEDFMASPDPFNPEKGAAKAKAAAKRDIEKEPETMDLDTFQGRQKFKEPTPTLQKKGSTTPIGTKLGDTTIGGEVKTTFDPSVINPKFRKKKPIDPDKIRAAQDAKKQQKGKDRIIDVDAGETTGELERTARAKIQKPKAKPSEIGQFQGPQMTPSQKSKRFNRPPIADPKNITGADPQTGQPMFMRPGVLDKSGRPKRLPKASPVELRKTRQAVKDMQDREKTIVSPVTGGRLPADSPQALQYYKQSDDYKRNVLGIDPKTGEYLTSDQRKKSVKGGSLVKQDKGGALDTQGKGGAVTVAPKEKSLVTKSVEFAKKNPATTFLTLDAIRKFLPSRSPFGVQGGRAGLRSAAR